MTKTVKRVLTRVVHADELQGWLNDGWKVRMPGGFFGTWLNGDPWGLEIVKVVHEVQP